MTDKYSQISLKHQEQPGDRQRRPHAEQTMKVIRSTSLHFSKFYLHTIDKLVQSNNFQKFSE